MDKTFLKKLGNNIKLKRKSKKLTQDDLGVNGISRSMISLVEIAKTDITVSKLKIIADNLNLKVRDLFDFEQ
ncbi:helix-turn-helix transcriptional regulator [bacterium]|nr:helix-turn-helix transcriptional regulator [bacterium]